ncbi:MAG: TlpA family protein disulfide reductase [Methylococcaceae bacterium]|nr:MAG: TlpA family protein disulfide reductase [Methylococcaceae bacterium]
MADWRGKPVLITFWASDCPACIKEIPQLINLYRRYAPRGLHMVAVAMAYDMPSHVVSLAKSMALPYPVALDPLGENARAFGDVALTPTTLLFGPDGRLHQRIVGDFDPAILAQHIESLLAEN